MYFLKLNLSNQYNKILILIIKTKKTVIFKFISLKF